MTTSTEARKPTAAAHRDNAPPLALRAPRPRFGRSDRAAARESTDLADAIDPTSSSAPVESVLSSEKPNSMQQLGTPRALSLLPPREHDRPQLRERALRDGVESMTDAELLGLLIERGTAQEPLERRVERLLRGGEGLGALAIEGVGALADAHGLGIAAAARLAAAFELGTRWVRQETQMRTQTFGRPSDVEAWARRRLAHLAHEELWALLLDGKNQLRGARQLARGGLHACAVLARDVLRPVVREAAGAFVLVHNHPSGDPIPSRDDVAFTRKVADGASTLGVVLVDHLVVASGGAVSMLEAGLFDELEPPP